MTNGTINQQPLSLLSMLSDRILLLRMNLQAVSPLGIIVGNITSTGSVLAGIAQTVANREILTGIVYVTGMGAVGLWGVPRPQFSTLGQNIITAGMPLPT